MATQVHCDRFRQEQYVPAFQVRTLLSVYVARRDERMANRGLGCTVKDLVSGEEKIMRISALKKMGVKFPNGKRVRAVSLRNGETYTMVGVPEKQNCGVFIVPRGTQYEYIYKGKPLAPGSCIVSDGKMTRVINYRLFRKMFIMGQNPVSAGRMRGSIARTAPKQQPVQQPRPTGFPIQFPSNNPLQGQAQPQIQQEQKYTAVGRILSANGELVGLVLTNGVKQADVAYKQCIGYALRGVLTNIKAVPRNGTTFLSGNGISIEALPAKQI